MTHLYVFDDASGDLFDDVGAAVGAGTSCLVCAGQSEAQVPVVLQPWVAKARYGPWKDALLGVLTDPPALQRGLVWRDELARLHHISSVTKLLMDQRLCLAVGLPVREAIETASHELTSPDAPALTDATAMVDDERVPARALSWRGLSFLLGADPRAQPFALVCSRTVHEWPALRRIPDPAD